MNTVTVLVSKQVKQAIEKMSNDELVKVLSDSAESRRRIEEKLSDDYELSDAAGGAGRDNDDASAVSKKYWPTTLALGANGYFQSERAHVCIGGYITTIGMPGVEAASPYSDEDNAIEIRKIDIGDEEIEVDAGPRDQKVVIELTPELMSEFISDADSCGESAESLIAEHLDLEFHIAERVQTGNRRFGFDFCIEEISKAIGVTEDHIYHNGLQMDDFAKHGRDHLVQFKDGSTLFLPLSIKLQDGDLVCFFSPELPLTYFLMDAGNLANVQIH